MFKREKSCFFETDRYFQAICPARWEKPGNSNAAGWRVRDLTVLSFWGLQTPGPTPVLHLVGLLELLVNWCTNQSWSQNGSEWGRMG